MKSILGSVASLVLGAVILSAATGCKVACKDNEQDNGGECTAKSLKRFEGTETAVSPVSYASGDNVRVETVYGNVYVKQGVTGKVSATFAPFDYEGYDEKDLATRQMNENLHVTNLTGGPEIGLSATRDDVSNGLGAHITLLIPPEFDGTITVENRGKGPINEFNSHVDFVGSATTVNVHGGASLSQCTVTGAASVTNTVVDCGDSVDVRGISDNFTLTARREGQIEDVAMHIELGSVSSTATGGIANSGGLINAWFPANDNFSVHSTVADPKAVIDPGTLPSGCLTSDNNATITCGTGGPVYTLSNTGATDEVFDNGSIFLQFN